ncbi:carotenoid biosynthesis protein [Nocardia sp. 2]|uniref:Carotenoid biosynthesis protein n=1 Tax=Nocardia acididurans TaxID=2802282 RepID=A0ABS1MB37_9NOCA|nr:carotenoid biosynthesis protein [Nocardia acididurans]MBL1077786.1 carotenoid biosynthesis protein [Nocardia acididurans]
MNRVQVAAIPAVLLVLVQISYPLTHGAARDHVTIAVVLLSAGAALIHAALTRGVRWAAGLVMIVSGAGLLAEIAGIATGFPFGCYEYASGRIGPEIAGVPVVVPLAWTGGVYPVWVVAGLLSARVTAARATATGAATTAPGRTRPAAAVPSSRAVLRISLTAVGAVGWDLFLDPQMVADGQWTWCSPVAGLPGLPEIPVTNYLGWLGVAFVMAGLLELWDRTAPDNRAALVVPVSVFLWTWLGSTLAHAVFLGLPVSAVYGFAGLGVLGIPLVRGLLARRITLGPGGHGTM